MKLCREDNKGRERPSVRIDTIDNCHLFTVSWLDRLRTTLPISAYNNFCGANYTHLEPSLIKVIDIFLKDTVFREYISYEVKLVLYNL